MSAVLFGSPLQEPDVARYDPHSGAFYGRHGRRLQLSTGPAAVAERAKL